jgi:peptidoglycan/xylan/chitin deacetylase (PgdA/CDA1 family)
MSLKQNKILKIAAIIIISLFIFFGSFYFFYLSPKYTVPILTYHDFGYGKGIKVAPENFERQMRYLKDKHYNVISLDELVRGIENGRQFSRNTVVITMDDGYRDNFTYAYPVLKKYSFPATIFLIANNIGTDVNFLNWDEVKKMSKDNISFGGHTKNHVYLPSIQEEAILWDEIAGCKEVLEKHIGIPIGYFSYPRGGFTEAVKLLVKEAGYKAACTTNRGHDILDKNDLYELNRISIRNRDNSFSLWAKVSGYYNLFKTRKSGD